MAPYKFDVILQMPELPAEELEKYAWDPDDRSINIYVKDEDRLTLHRHPVAQSTDCIRGKVGIFWVVCNLKISFCSLVSHVDSMFGNSIGRFISVVPMQL
jgi:hypothetical protein